LFLVNYARIKPEIAMKALPTLADVSDRFAPLSDTANNTLLGHG
jgi:hypothetical protein